MSWDATTTGRVPASRRLVLALLFALLAWASVMAASPSADANSPIEEFVTEPSSTQAGGHPDMLFKFTVGNRYTQGFPSTCYCENPKEIRIGAPTGVIGAPHALPQCTAALLVTGRCSPDTQIGVMALALGCFEECLWMLTPLFNLEPREGQPGLIGFREPLLETETYQDVSARTDSDYGLDVTVEGITQFATPNAIRQILWGVPSDPKHDALRFPQGSAGAFCNDGEKWVDPTAFVFGEDAQLPSFCKAISGPPIGSTPSNAPLKPFVSNPTTCGVPLESTIDVLAYDHGTDHDTAPWPGTTGCDQLAFNPSLSAVPTTRDTDTAAGLDVKLSVPQGDSPEVPSASQIRGTDVTLPEGFTINPNAADGKVSCSDAEAGFGTREPSRCPEHAKVGTVEIVTSALPGPIDGGIFLGDPQPGNRYRILLTAGGFGTNVKLAGSVRPDPQSGRVVVSFKDLPQSPLTEFNMHFFGSERGLLATPERCGTYAVDTVFEPWNDALPNQTSKQFFNLTSGPAGSSCPGSPRPFDPGVQVGMADNTAGQHAPFHLTVNRPDGNQLLTALNVSAPPGFSATLRGVPYCSESALRNLAGQTGLAEQAAPACPATSRIGTAAAGVGAGSHPLYAPGNVYLAGPYRGAPLSLVVAIPAVSGPYDLGNVIVRAALEVDAATARVSAISDPISQILEGIPLRLRYVNVSLDRPGFTLNPTNCDPLAFTTSLFGNQGTRADQRNRFQVANCSGLPFGPKLGLRLSGGMKRTGHPALRAVLTAKPGEANIGRATVKLPDTMIIDNAHFENVCTRVQFAARACPADSQLGTARAETPLLDSPLEGPVYLRTSGKGLPDLAADLRGQIDIVLVGRIDTVKRRLRTTFGTVPDVPVRRFALNLQGGGKGLLVNRTNLCRSPGRVSIKLIGHNADTIRSSPRPRTACGTGRGNREKRSGEGR